MTLSEVLPYDKRSMKEVLEDFTVCPRALDWIGDRTVEESVSKCPKGEWMLWMAYELNLDKRKLVLAAGLCAETSKHLMTCERSIKAIEGATAYGRGEIDEEELERLSHEAYKAEVDAAAASAASYAASATFTTAFTTTASYFAALKASEKQTAEICREVFGEWLIQELAKIK